jgi:hypothetical protein
MADPRSYIIVFNYAALNRDRMTTFLDRINGIVNWRASGVCIEIATEFSLTTLRELVHVEFPNLHFVVVHVTPENIDGWWDGESWDFISFPRPASITQSISNLPSNG